MAEDKVAWLLTEFVKDYVNKEYSSDLNIEEIQKYFGPCYKYYEDLNDRKVKLENDEYVSMYTKEGKDIRPFYDKKQLKYDIDLIRSSILLTGLTRQIFNPLDFSNEEDLEWKRKIEHLYGVTGFFIKFKDEEGSNTFRNFPQPLYEYYEKKADFDFLNQLKEATCKLEYNCGCELEELDKMENWEVFQMFTLRNNIKNYRECLHLFNQRFEEYKANNNDKKKSKTTFIQSFKNIFKNQKKSVEDDNASFDKNKDEILNYIRKLRKGEVMLENNQHIKYFVGYNDRDLPYFHNPKLLKYDIKQIKMSISMLAWFVNFKKDKTPEDEALLEELKICFQLLAFFNDFVPDDKDFIHPNEVIETLYKKNSHQNIFKIEKELQSKGVNTEELSETMILCYYLNQCNIDEFNGFLDVDIFKD